MRNLEISALVSLDGVVSDPQGWADAYFDAQAAEQSLKRLQAADGKTLPPHSASVIGRAGGAASRGLSPCSSPSHRLLP
jgi:hypothetical protein